MGVILLKELKNVFGVDDSMLYGAPAVGGAPAAAAGGEAAAEEAAPKKEKTLFNVILDKFDAGSKLKIVKEVRAITGLGLKQAKDLVESAPVAIKEDMPKADAQELADKLTALG